jgi:hypothetical protein
MSGNSDALAVPHLKQIITALSRLIDPHNTAEPIHSHKHAIKLKWAAELASKKLGDRTNGSLDSETSGNQLSFTLSTLPSPLVPSKSPEAQINMSQPNSAIDKDNSSSKDSENSEEPSEHDK